MANYEEDIRMIRRVAEGGEFDTVAAVRSLARRLSHLHSGGDGGPVYPDGEEPVSLENPVDSILDLEVLSEEIRRILRDAGYSTVEDVQGASNEDLLDIPGIGPKRVEEIRLALS